ncbi:MAG: hypothetical protein AVDCRST_MAG68-3516, partial [uncultured Gemmatimonadetes bacterium]
GRSPYPRRGAAPDRRAHRDGRDARDPAPAGARSAARVDGGRDQPAGVHRARRRHRQPGGAGRAGARRLRRGRQPHLPLRPRHRRPPAPGVGARRSLPRVAGGRHPARFHEARRPAAQLRRRVPSEEGL